MGSNIKKNTTHIPPLVNLSARENGQFSGMTPSTVPHVGPFLSISLQECAPNSLAFFAQPHFSVCFKHAWSEEAQN